MDFDLDDPWIQSVLVDREEWDGSVRKTLRLQFTDNFEQIEAFVGGDAVERGTADCKICGAPEPAGHVPVRNENGQIIGRICSRHTFWEAARTGVLYIEITEISE